MKELTVRQLIVLLEYLRDHGRGDLPVVADIAMSGEFPNHEFVSFPLHEVFEHKGRVVLMDNSAGYEV